MKQYVKESLAWSRYVVWWVALGVASSIGLGAILPFSSYFMNAFPGSSWAFPFRNYLLFSFRQIVEILSGRSAMRTGKKSVCVCLVQDIKVLG